MNNSIDIFVPRNNSCEREYIIKLLLEEYLNLKINIILTNEVNNYILKNNDKTLEIEDHFFNKYPKVGEYLSKDNIPLHVSWYNCIKDINIPIIFGRNVFSNDADYTLCGLDIFASSYFMITRWEEEVLGRKDTGKCDESLLFSVVNNIYDRPIVNEYLELLSKLLIRLDILPKNNYNTFLFKITHDVDRCYLSDWSEMIFNVCKGLKNSRYTKSLKLLKDYCLYKLFRPNPFDTFKEFTTLSNKITCQEEFYFKAVEPKEIGFTYSIFDDKVKKILYNLYKESMNIGFHPSENTFNNTEMFDKEYSRLRSACPTACVNSGRNHGLFCNVNTLRQWEKNGFRNISNYGFQRHFGFRCGICYSFPYFDFYLRKKMNLREIPFLAMDTVMLRNKPNENDAFSKIKSIIDLAIYYKGIFCINWHSNVLNMWNMLKYKIVYKKILDYVFENTKTR